MPVQRIILAMVFIIASRAQIDFNVTNYLGCLGSISSKKFYLRGVPSYVLDLRYSDTASTIKGRYK